MGEGWPETRAPRGWVPRRAPGRDTWPKRRPPNATHAVPERINAAPRGDAEAAITAVTAAYQAQEPNAGACLDRDQEKRLRGGDVLAAPWLHWRTTTPVVTDAGVGQGVHAVGEGRRALAHAERAASAAARPRQGAMCRGDSAAQARGRGGEGGRLIRSVRPQHLTIPPCQHDLAVRPLRWPGGHRRRRENRCRGTSQGCRVSVPILYVM